MSVHFSAPSKNEVWKEQALESDSSSALIVALSYGLCDPGGIT